MKEKFLNFFFIQQGPRNLAILRILFFTYFIFCIYAKDYAQFTNLPDVLAVEFLPFYYTGYIDLPVILTPYLLWLWKFSAFLSVLGLYTRYSTTLVFLLSVYFLPLPMLFEAKVSHSYPLVLFAMLAFVLSRPADIFSLDAWLAKKRGEQLTSEERIRSGVYAWPIRFVKVMWVLMFFASALSKLRTGGLHWLNENAIKVFAHRAEFVFQDSAILLGLNHFFKNIVLGSSSLFLFSLVVLAVELLTPLVLVQKYKTGIIVFLIFLMQLGIYFTMAINFLPMLIIYAYFIDYDRIMLKLRLAH